MVIGLYIGLLLVLGLLGFLGSADTLPEGVVQKGIEGFFNRAASYLCVRIWSRRAPAGSLGVQMHLQTLYPGGDPAERLRGYYVTKLGRAMMLICACTVLAGLTWYAARQNDLLDESGNLQRADYGGGIRKAPLTATSADGETVLGDYDLTLQERQYTHEEAEQLLVEALTHLPELILGSNESFDEVYEDLNLVKKIDGYPFSFSWKSDDYAIMHSDGRISRDLPELGGIVTLTATISYEEEQWIQVIHARVLHRQLTREELLHQVLEEELEDAERADPHALQVNLPQMMGSVPITWSIRPQDNSIFLLLLGVLTAILVYTAADKDLARKGEERRRQMTLDYPQFLSQLVLYMGAGMSVRQIFRRLSDVYQEDRARGTPIRYLYEEITRCCRELSGGMSETLVYERLGIRCGAQAYVRLCTLLTQNLKRGNAELLPLLSEEARKASQERMDHARKCGEEAGTRLLLPMMMLLAVVMVIIMIPAYMSF